MHWLAIVGPARSNPSAPNMPSRRIVRDINEDVFDVPRALVDTEAFEESRRNRNRVKMLLAGPFWITNTPAVTLASRQKYLNDRRKSLHRRERAIGAVTEAPLSRSLVRLPCVSCRLIQEAAV
jgi:hypothetical protein